MQGPPSDSAKGFEPGWRKIDLEKIATLPWANTLLNHLLTDVSPVVSGAPTTATTDAPVAIAST